MEEFARWLLLRGNTDVTNKNHIKVLSVILRKCTPLSFETFQSFVTNLLASGRTPSTVNQYIGTMRLYATFAGLDERLQKFKILRVREQVQKGTLSDAEIEAFLSLPPPPGKNKDIWEKDTLFFWLLTIGSRPAEIAHIKKQDISDSNILLTHTKTHKPRRIPIPPPIKERLIAYIKRCPTDELFLTRTGRVYSYAKWQHSFDERIKLLGIDRPNISLYSLRTTCITNLLKNDVSIAKIGKLCGTSFEMIEKNYSALVISDLESAIRLLPIVSKHTEPKVEEVKEQIEKILKLFSCSYSISASKKQLQVKIRIENPMGETR